MMARGEATGEVEGGMAASNSKSVELAAEERPEWGTVWVEATVGASKKGGS